MDQKLTEGIKMQNLKRNFLVITLLITVFSSFAFAQTGSITADVVPININPTQGAEILVQIEIDVTNVNSPDNYLGSYTGALSWDPSIL